MGNAEPEGQATTEREYGYYRVPGHLSVIVEAYSVEEAKEEARKRLKLVDALEEGSVHIDSDHIVLLDWDDIPDR